MPDTSPEQRNQDQDDKEEQECLCRCFSVEELLPCRLVIEERVVPGRLARTTEGHCHDEVEDLERVNRTQEENEPENRGHERQGYVPQRSPPAGAIDGRRLSDILRQ